MNRIDKKLRELKKTGKKAFVAFITAGYPDLGVTEKLILEFAGSGVDIVELGVPFSDPMADGPVIQQSSESALRKGTHLEDILDLVRRVRRHTAMPIALMTYYNPVFCFGEERFVKAASRCGVDGVIVPDLPPEESKTLIRLANRHQLDVINFIAPTTPVGRAKRIARTAKGFIYYVSLTGVTGARQGLAPDLVRNLKKIKKITAKPVCVGFGVSSRRQVREIYRLADGVIVGSAIVGEIKKNLKNRNLVRNVGRFVRSLNSNV